jgi:glyoxylase-like metal-dependent hydrolase (beta-lactamase superfamily II)
MLPPVPSRTTRASLLEVSMPVHIEIGSVTIQRIVEQEGPFFEALQFFPALTNELLVENRAWLQPKFMDARDTLVLCIQSYLVQTPDHNILVDTCVGNHKPRPNRAFWHMLDSDRYEKNLAAAGLGVAEVDFVMCTHLHPDHVGWNTRLENGRWVPTFPNARYIFADRELEYWTVREKEDSAASPWITDSVLPIVAAQRAEIVKSTHQFDERVTLISTPGHTIDHFSLRVGEAGADAIITGDMIHSPLQTRYPELSARPDYDPEQSAQTRRKIFAEICGSSTLLCTAHFPSPSVGRLVAWGDAFDFVAL